jgi:hypothetical protein
MRSGVIALTLLAVVAASAIVCVIWLVLGRSRASSGVGISAGGISVMAGGISWLEIYVFVGAGLTICFVLAAFVALLVRRRDGPEY